MTANENQNSTSDNKNDNLNRVQGYAAPSRNFQKSFQLSNISKKLFESE